VLGIKPVTAGVAGGSAACRRTARRRGRTGKQTVRIYLSAAAAAYGDGGSEHTLPGAVVGGGGREVIDGGGGTLYGRLYLHWRRGARSNK